MSSAAASAHADSAAPAAAAASALPDMKAIKARVDAIAAQATPQKISKSQTQSAAKKKKIQQFKAILRYGNKARGKSSKHPSGVVDPFLSQQYLHGHGNGQ